MSLYASFLSHRHLSVCYSLSVTQSPDYNLFLIDIPEERQDL